MKFMLRRTIYTRKFGIEFHRDVAMSSPADLYKYLIWIWLWNTVLAIFISKKKEERHEGTQEGI